MKKIMFRQQVCIALAILLLGLILSTIFKQGVFANMGTVLYGLLFVLNPIFPERCKNV